jgi:WD40 repeat protein
MLQNHYLPSDRVFCSLQVPDLAAQCADALISTCNVVEVDISLNNPADLVVKTEKIREVEGFITSRKIDTALSFGKSDNTNIVKIWDMLTETKVGELGGQNHTDVIRSISLSEDGSTLVSVGKDGIINKWKCGNK